MNLAAVVMTGLFAGGVSCAAVQGGLLTGLITRQRAATAQPAAPPRVGHRTSKADGATAGTGATRAVQTAQRPSWRVQLGDDLAPVGGFLAGKLVSHTLLGALLGALGGAVQLSVGARTWLQISAGLLIIVFGLAQLGVPGFRRIVIESPTSWMKIVRNRARSRAALAPALLGLATVLIPCGVTLSVEALALTSGSALAGAATMAVFVLGTSPLFAALGYAARKAATAWRGRLALLTGLVVVALGLYTLNVDGLRDWCQTGREAPPCGPCIPSRSLLRTCGMDDSNMTSNTKISLTVLVVGGGPTPPSHSHRRHSPRVSVGGRNPARVTVTSRWTAAVDGRLLAAVRAWRQ